MKTIKFIKILSFLFILIGLLVSLQNTKAQETVTRDVTEMTREEVLDLSYDQLLAMPLADLLVLADIVGVSMDELLQLAMNKNVSTASKQMETVFDSPLSTSVITRQDIRFSGANSIGDALRLIPGMIVREESNGNYDIHIRGFDNVPPENFSHFSENTISLVMVDGVPVYNNVAGGTFWETLPVSLEQVERIDVVRGPSSALYGPNAVSGVINIITRTAKDDFTVNATQRIGTANSIIGDMFSSYKVNDALSITIGGKYDIRNRFSDVQYNFLTGEYEEFQDSMLNITGIDYFSGPQYQSLPQDRSKEVFSGNVNVMYNPSDKLMFRITGGLQNSKIQSVFFENIATPYSVRSSETGFGALHAKIGNLSAYGSFQGGSQDLSEGMVRPVIQYDMSTIVTNVEYEFDLGKVSILPGFNYQYASYNDAPYEVKKRLEQGLASDDGSINGLFHGEKYTSLLAGSLRADYLPVDNLRLIAALRADNYKHIDDPYFSYQFVASYNLNSNHLFRAVYSKANRGGFVGDLHANFRNPILEGAIVGVIPEEDYNMFKGYLQMDPSTAPLVAMLPPVAYVYSDYTQYYIGSTNSDRDLDLMSMDMFELGWRGKVTNNFQIELEAFHSRAKDFNALVSYPRYDTTNYSISELTGIPGYENMMTPLPDSVNIEDPLYYENLPLKANQTGISATLSMSVNQKLLLKVFGTYQQTQLQDHITILKERVDQEHKNTPSFYGGFTAMYLPTSKWELFLGSYFYGSQIYNRYYRPLSNNPEDVARAMNNAQDEINSKIILNTRIAYKIWKDSRVFIEGKNLLMDESREFGFGDKSVGLFFVGASLGF